MSWGTFTHNINLIDGPCQPYACDVFENFTNGVGNLYFSTDDLVYDDIFPLYVGMVNGEAVEVIGAGSGLNDLGGVSQTAFIEPGVAYDVCGDTKGYALRFANPTTNLAATSFMEPVFESTTNRFNDLADAQYNFVFSAAKINRLYGNENVHTGDIFRTWYAIEYQYMSIPPSLQTRSWECSNYVSATIDQDNGRFRFLWRCRGVGGNLSEQSLWTPWIDCDWSDENRFVYATFKFNDNVYIDGDDIVSEHDLTLTTAFFDAAGDLQESISTHKIIHRQSLNVVQESWVDIYKVPSFTTPANYVSEGMNWRLAHFSLEPYDVTRLKLAWARNKTEYTPPEYCANT
jgi:hypothetical protein